MGMGCKYVWLANAARAGVPLALLGARGGWRLRARGGVHLHGSRGGALGGGSSQLPPWWPLQSRSEHAERAAPPKVRALAKKIISTKLETCTKDDTTERGGWARFSKTVRDLPFSSRMVHQHAPTRRAPLPATPQKLPGPSHAPADTRRHGRWITMKGARPRDGLHAVRQGRAKQAYSRSGALGAKKRTSEM